MFTYIGILIIILFLLSGISLIVLSILTYRRNRSPLSQTFLLLLIFCSVWVFSHLLELVFSSRFGTMLWGRLKYSGIVFIPVAWLNFSLHYTGWSKHVSWRKTILLLLVPLIVLFVVWSNHYHHLFWGDIVIEELGGLTYFSATLGPFFYLNTVYIYTLIIVGIFLILHALLNLHREYWKQAVMISVGILTPLLGNIIYIFTYTSPRLDITPLLFLPANISLAFGMRNFNFLDALLIGRETVFEKSSRAIFVLDNKGKIIDLNKAGEELVKEIGSHEDVIGEKPEDIFSKKFALKVALNARNETRHEFWIERDGYKRYFEAHIDPLQKSRELQIGWSITVRDITERKKADKELLKLEKAVEGSVAGFAFLGMDGEIEYVNPKLLEMFGYEEDEVIGNHISEFLEYEEGLEKFSRSLEEGACKGVMTGLRKDGSTFEILANGNIIKDDEGNPEGIVTTVIDSTQRKEVE